MSFEVRPLTPYVGAEILGADLAHPPTDELVESVRDALRHHLVVFFRGQDLTPEQYHAFGACFGELQVHVKLPNLGGELQNVQVLDSFGSLERLRGTSLTFHADTTFLEQPPSTTMLLARELPPIGGDTLWSSMYRAFETLSEPMQEFLAGLHCTHGFETKWDERAVHPVVLTHPETGRRALYVNKTHSRRIVELTEDESENLLAFLYRHVLSPDFSMRWTWRVGDIAFWDNRSAQHYAVGDYAERRVMHRMIIGTHTPSYVPETVATPLTVS